MTLRAHSAPYSAFPSVEGFQKQHLLVGISLTFQVNSLTTANLVDRITANTIPVQTALTQTATDAMHLISRTQHIHLRQH